MSEYQYYEFRAIDRPLTREEMAALRDITSRAEITPTSLINEYHYGDFKGNPLQLMERYFDAFLYYANWGTHRLMLRVPKNLINLELAQSYATDNNLSVVPTQDHVIFDFDVNEEDGWDGEDFSDVLLDVIPLRQDLMRGDYRCLYLGWLAAVRIGDVGDDELEPPVPPGMQKLSVPLSALADFLYIDEAMLNAAMLVGESEAPPEPTAEELKKWLASLGDAEKVELLHRVMQGESSYLGAELLQRYYKTIKPSQQTQGKRRTVEELLQLRDRAQKERERIEAEKRAQREREAAEERARRAEQQAKARKEYLQTLAGREEELWQQAEQAASTKLPKEYQRVITILTDLRDRAQLDNSADRFTERIAEFRNRHSRKSSLCKLLSKANLA
jgi:hypothetical protein